MNRTVSVVTIPDLTLVVCRATSFPDGIRDSWQRLESRLTSLRSRMFYGLTYFEDGELNYYAAVQPLDEAEITKLGFPVRKIAGGKYARVKVNDWPEHADEISGIFEELMAAYPKDPNGPTIEFYRSQRELHLLIPLSIPETEVKA